MNPPEYTFEGHYCIKCGVYQSTLMLTDDKRFCASGNCKPKREEEQATESTFRGSGR